MSARREDRDIPKSRISRENIGKSLRLFRYLGVSDRWLFFAGTVFLFATAVTALLFPKLTGSLVDTALPGKGGTASLDELQHVAYWFVWLFLAQAVFSFLRISIYVRVTENMVFHLREDLFTNLLLKPMDYFHRNRGGDILSRFSTDIAQIQDTFTTHIAMFLRQILVIAGGLFMLFFTSLKLAALMLLTVPVVVIVSLVFGRYIRKVSKEVQQMSGDNNVIVDEVITGIVNVKSFTNELFERLRFGRSAEQIRRESIYRGMLRGAFSSFIIVCLFGAMTFLIYRGLQMVQAGELRIGEMIQFMFITGFVGGSIGGMAEQYVQIQRTLGAVERVFDVIDGEKESAWESGAIRRFRGNLRFDDLRFHYPSRPGMEVLTGISFDVKAGEQIALVGSSGSGKSTMASLLLGLYAPVSGKVLIDGEDTAGMSLHERRSNMALVPQEVILFGGTIYDNIRYGKPDADAAAIESAARLANAHDFIASFPEGYQTMVGDRGIRLSGGQKQRIAIARAILRNPSILILDEATSSLDTASEQQVQSALENLMQGRTSLVIAHRLSTIRNADRILVLDQGRIAESGNHETLMALPGGLYRKMYEMQEEKVAV